MSADGAIRSMDPNELVASFRGNVAQMHALVDALEEGPVRARLQRHAALVHGTLEAMAVYAGDTGVIAFDGTSKPPPGP